MLDTPAFVYVSGVGGDPWDADYYEMKVLTKDGIETIVANMSDSLGSGVYRNCKYAQLVGTTEKSEVIFKCSKNWEKEGDLDKLFLVPFKKEPGVYLMKEAEFQNMVVKGSTFYWGEYGVNGSEIFKCSISSSSPHSNCDMTTSSLGFLPKNSWSFYMSPSDEVVITNWLAYDPIAETNSYEVAFAIPHTPLFNVTGTMNFQFIEVPDMPTVDDPVDGKDDGPPPPPPPSSDLTFTSGQAKAILDEFDSDGDGQLNYGELTGEK
jgi:hypothetical protein